jgi:transposase
MKTNTLLPDPSILKIQRIIPSDEAITIEVRTSQPQASCPVCQQASRKVHSRYSRSLADLPWQGIPVRIQLHLRRFFCLNDACSRKIFAERLPSVAQRYARKTCRLNDALAIIGFALGGEAGSRLSRLLALKTSADTLLRRIRQFSIIKRETPRVLGVDDWSFRKGQTYGTILVDLEKHCPIDLLQDREAETLKAWLQAHPGIEIISRDRATAYAEAARKGAPQAVQIADRFHLLKNLVDAFEFFLKRQQKSIRGAAREIYPQRTDEPPKPQRPSATELSRQRRLARYNRVKELHQQGATTLAIARQLNMHRRTVRHFIRCEEFPERLKPSKRRSGLDGFIGYIKQRWDEGCHNSSQLWREIREHGYKGSESMLRHYLAKWRLELPPELRRYRRNEANKYPMPIQLPSARRMTWLLLDKVKERKAEEHILLKRLEGQSPEIDSVKQLANRFFKLINGRMIEDLDGWIEETSKSQSPEMKAFAQGIIRDKAAVEAALKYEWSQGQVEGQVNKLKTIKRGMYGRAKFDLLKARVLNAA